MPTDDLDEDFDEETEPDLEGDEPDLDEEDLEEEPLEDDEFDETSIDEESDEEESDEEDDGAAAVARKKAAGDDEDDDDELNPDDVEADLDTILKDRIASADDLEDEDEEEEEEVAGEPGTRVQPKTDSEFVCKSCFLVKSVSQRVPGTDDLCNDCV